MPLLWSLLRTIQPGQSCHNGRKPGPWFQKLLCLQKQAEWYHWFQELRRWRQLFGHVNIPQKWEGPEAASFGGGKAFPRWVHAQATAIRKRQLQPSQVAVHPVFIYETILSIISLVIVSHWYFGLASLKARPLWAGHRLAETVMQC